MDQSTRLSAFLEFSSTLTGVSQKVVGEAQQAALYLESYTTLADAVAGSGATDALLQFWKTFQNGMPPIAVAAGLLNGSFDTFSPDKTWPFSAMTKALMKLLLLGVWYDPAKPDDEGTIAKSALYAEGLVWLIAQANPTGASKLAYGHWANPPPPLKNLIGQ